MDVCAGLASSIGDWVHAARFFGVAEALRERTKLHRDVADESAEGPEGPGPRTLR